MNQPTVTLHDLGCIAYKTAWDFQERLFNDLIIEKRNGNTRAMNHLILCEHPHVFTLGKSGNPSNLLADESVLNQLDAEFHQINRGGDITYHGPGQLVVYPVFDLEQFFSDIHKYMRYLEESVIRVLADYGIKGERIAGLTGVWMVEDAPRKIAAFGVKCSRWVTMHGIGFNVNTDLSYFDQIIPCGIDDKQVTSVARELGHEVTMQEIKMDFLREFQALFEFELINV